MSEQLRAKNKKTLSRLLLVVVGMVGFAFALVPLYNVFCSITGINGKTAGKTTASVNMQQDSSRTIRLEFLAMENTEIKATFHPRKSGLDINPGKIYSTDFYVKNNTDKAIVLQAIPSISPGQVALYLHKTECFCFNQQPLKPGEEKWMPLRFFLDTEFPEDIKELTLQYTLFDVTPTTAMSTVTGK
ncbi:MAG TPA: cytochrome c oxidase assembly protein [Aeromonadales bacterium]|nr:cytochrome c oxidase assembly protein [Aeromonadales bacterium]